MNLKEYVLIPLFDNVVLPYEHTVLKINKNLQAILKTSDQVIIAFEKVDIIENSITLEYADKALMIGKYATIVTIHSINETENIDEIEISVTGIARVMILGTRVIEDNTILAEATIYNPTISDDSYKEFNDVRLSLCDIMQSLRPSIEMYTMLAMTPLEFFYFVLKELGDSNIAYKQVNLEQQNILEGLQSIFKLFFQYNKKFQESIEQELHDKFKKNIEEYQRNYFLNEQLKVVKKELEKINPIDENNIECRIKEHPHIPENIKKILLKEYEKIRHNNALSSEYTVTQNYLNISLALPWGQFSNLTNITLKKAQEILNHEHYGLEDVKENILQYLAAILQTKQNVLKVLLLVGPPGVGKTSIGQSIAKCLNRKFIFISLTSVTDIADLTGHRRTYVGAYPGQLVTKITEAGVMNPVILLDEVDKMINSKYGTNPMNVLVSLLDPTQNNNFTDNFLGYPFDMSKVVFILTANTIEDIPYYIRSRIEIIHIDGYTLDEKSHIVTRSLLPKIYKNLCISSKKIDITDEAIHSIIKNYTREMGVRHLNQVLNRVLQKALYIRMQQEEEQKISKKTTISKKNLKEFVNDIEIDFDLTIYPSEVIGLAWTSVGGDVLKIQAVFLESSTSGLVITGNIGKVMEESAKVALSLIKESHFIKTLKVPEKFFSTHSLHIHVPEGAVPKDGPSAGVTIYSAILLALKNKVKNTNQRAPIIAMTGEVSLSRDVLPVGGIKQKILAAQMYGIKEVILPKKNKANVEKLKNLSLENIKIHFISQISELEKIFLANL